MNMMINLLPIEAGRMQQNQKRMMPDKMSFNEMLQRQQKLFPISQNNQIKNPKTKYGNHLNDVIKDSSLINPTREQHIIKNNSSTNLQDTREAIPIELDDKDEATHKELALLMQSLIDLLPPSLANTVGEAGVAEEISLNDTTALKDILTQLEHSLVLKDSRSLESETLLKQKLGEFTKTLEEGNFSKACKALLKDLAPLAGEEHILEQDIKISENQLASIKVKEVHTHEDAIKPSNKPQNLVETMSSQKTDVHLMEKSYKGSPNFSTEFNHLIKSVDDAEMVDHNIVISQHQEAHKLIQSVESLLKAGEAKEALGKNIISQMAANIEFSVKNGKTEVNLQLIPENLGKLTIKLELSHGTLSGKVFTDSIEVKQILEANFTQLKSALEEKGMSIGSLDVFVGQDSEKAFHQQMGGRAKEKTKPSSVRLVSELTSLYEEESTVTGILYQSNSTFEGVV